MIGVDPHTRKAQIFFIYGGSFEHAFFFSPRLFIQEEIDHLPVLPLTGCGERSDPPVIWRIDVGIVVYQELDYLLIAVLHGQVDSSISVLKCVCVCVWGVYGRDGDTHTTVIDH